MSGLLVSPFKNRSTTLDGTAKLRFWPSSSIPTATPTTSPFAVNIGLPEEPGEIGAEICRSSWPCIVRIPATTPVLMLLSKPDGLPIAKTAVPGFGWLAASFRGTDESSPSGSKTARSFTGSVLTTFKPTRTAPRSRQGVPPRTTCSFVMILFPSIENPVASSLRTPPPHGGCPDRRGTSRYQHDSGGTASLGRHHRRCCRYGRGGRRRIV